MLKGVITYTGSPEVKAKAFKGIVKDEMQGIIDFWHDKYLKKHFTKAGAREYEYEDRSAGHMKKKIKYFRHADPLVYTGDMKRMLLRRIAISGTAKKATGTLRGPKYMYQYHKDYKQPHKAEEIVKTTQPELLIFARRLDKKITKRINSIKTRQTRRF